MHHKTTGALIYVPEQMRIDIYAALRQPGMTQAKLANLMACSCGNLSLIKTGKVKAITEPRFNIIEFVLGKTYERRYVSQCEHSGGSGPSQRGGLAHLCVNGKLICGEKDYSVRYYRAHEEWLNQVEICPDCLAAWQKAEAVWNKNQQ